MTTGIDALSEKEKDTLRLILRGHDAKSAACALGLSVHTVNERLREARRKLGVTSSREAARRLLAAEGETPESLGDKGLGDASGEAPAEGRARSATRRPLVLATIGVTAMSLILAALFLPAAPLSVTVSGPTAEAAATEGEATEAARAAEAFLVMIDESRWADSYAATGTQFRKANSLQAWTDVSTRVRAPHGKLVTRDLVTNEFVPAPPKGYQLVKFASAYADGTNQIESVSLEWEDGAWRVVGIVIG